MDYNSTGNDKKGRSKTEKIDCSEAQSLLKAVRDRFFNNYDAIVATDAGSWQLELTGMDDVIYNFTGSLLASYYTDLSKMIHNTLHMPYLYVFGSCILGSFCLITVTFITISLIMLSMVTVNI